MGNSHSMAVGRQQRMSDRRDRIAAVFGESQRPVVVDVLTLLELAWHDCYGGITPPENIIDDLLLLSEGDIGQLVSACRLATQDWRDVVVAADQLRT